MAQQHLYQVVHDTAQRRPGTVRAAATWARTSARANDRSSAFERQDRRATHQVDPGGGRPFLAIDRSLRRCRLGRVFLSEVPRTSGD